MIRKVKINYYYRYFLLTYLFFLIIRISFFNQNNRFGYMY